MKPSDVEIIEVFSMHMNQIKAPQLNRIKS